MEHCVTITDAWRVFCELHGTEQPVRTQDELRQYIHDQGLRYEDLDQDFWDKLFDSGWHIA